MVAIMPALSVCDHLSFIHRSKTKIFLLLALEESHSCGHYKCTGLRLQIDGMRSWQDTILVLKCALDCWW